jgi:hypothetical protein
MTLTPRLSGCGIGVIISTANSTSLLSVSHNLNSCLRNSTANVTKFSKYAKFIATHILDPPPNVVK